MTDKKILRDVQTNGITLSITEQGEGPLVLLCHGWPELAYSWRHQIPVLAQAGYRIVAPDMRGYGGSTAPRNIDAYGMTDLVGDMVGLVAALGETRACIVGHDWGAPVAWGAALMRPDLFAAVAALSVPFSPRNAHASPFATLRAAGLEDLYWFYFDREGVPEAEFERDVASALRRVLFTLSGDAPADRLPLLTVPAGSGFLDRTINPPALPHWLTESDLEVFAAAFRKSGFRGPFNWYRNIEGNWKALAPFQGARVTQPALFIAGARDEVINSPVGERSLKSLARNVPNIRDILLIPDAGHWIQQERPSEVNAALLRFLAADYPS
jgi:pimeloyl-ACP methyl ester carboxylesterase